jgi:sRNA-binding carbon storage regulator CsrA
MIQEKGCLALNVKEGESVFLEVGGVVIKVILGKSTAFNRRRLLFKAPQEVRIHREELYLEANKKAQS